MEIEGRWSAGYSAITSPVGNEDAEEIATLELKDGCISGTDPFGGVYEGKYTLSGERFSATIRVSTTDPDAITVFEGLRFPLDIQADAIYRSPDHFSGTGVVNGSNEIVFNCS